MRRPLILLCVLFLSKAAPADELATLERLYGPSDLETISGNGGLTVGWNGQGRMNLCRWPSPSFHDQLSYRTVSRDLPNLGVKPFHGAEWGIGLDGEVVWLSDPRWIVSQDYQSILTNVIRTTAVLPGSPVRITQTAFVHPARDLLTIRLDVEGVGAPPALYWYSNFTPCTRQISEIPLGDWAFDGLNDFAAFALGDEGVICHFRPNKPGRADWKRAESLLAREAVASDWASFGDGVWIVYRSIEGFAGEGVGAGDVDPGTLVSTGGISGDLSGSAVGQTFSLAQLKPVRTDAGYSATILIGFAKDFEGARDLLEFGYERGYERLLQETNAHWFDWIGEARIPTNDDVETVKLMLRCLLTLATVTDRYSGAMVRSPSTQPPLARDWPRHGAWMTHALDLAGLHEAAGSHSLFYARLFREEATRGRPAGSLPAAVYADGVEATPHFVLDLEAVAMTVWAFAEHGKGLPESSRQAYFEKVWEATERGADFLAGWTVDRKSAPSHAFDPNVFHDRQSWNQLVSVRLGLHSALSIARQLDREPPDEWLRRERALDALLLNSSLDMSLTWPLEEPLPFSLDHIFDPGDPRLEVSIQRRLDALPNLTGYAAAKALCEVVMLWRNDPAKLKTLAPLVKPTLIRALTVPAEHLGKDGRGWAFPDALTAALCYISAISIYDAGA